jgi:hypothetical protein
MARPRLPGRAWHDAGGLERLLDTGLLHRTRLAAAYEAKQFARRLLGRGRYARIQARVARDQQQGN